MRVSLLGPLAVERDGSPLAVGGARLRALLARLALDAGAAVSADRLVDDLWETAPPADSAHALQSLVSRLRRALGDPGLVVGDAAGYRLVLAPEAVDAVAFERDLHAGRLEAALARWHGPALADLATGFAFAARAADRLEARRADARAALARARLDAGDAAGALALLGDERPADERAAALGMEALAAAGRPADALAAYEQLRRALDDELGTTPSAATRALHARLLTEEPHAPTAPPSTAPSEAVGNLPAPVTPLVGREAEVDEALARLQGARLLTLVGPGGAGKTRLGLEVARRRAGALREGAWLVELAPLVDGGAIPESVLAALGRREAQLPDRRPPVPGAPRDGLERVVDVLAGEQLLLVLDNCEHLVEDAARVVDALLRALPDVQVLTTSREPLGIGGEHLLDVGPLGLPEPGAPADEALQHPAVALFAARATQTAPGFAVDARTVGPVVELCRRLDGLPLALELAAARLRTLPVAQVAARLDDRFRLLTGGSRAALPRQRTLRAVVDWSWELLAEPERRLARRLAVFNAPVTPQDAEAVCGGDGVDPLDVGDTLSALAERSLLQPVAPAADGEPRYRMLETLREYGVERLAEAGELDRLRTAHARHFAQLAATADPLLRGPAQVGWFHRLTAVREDLLAALRRLADEGDARRAVALAADLLWLWALSSAAEEAIDTTRMAIAVPVGADPPAPADHAVVEAAAEALTLQRRADVDVREAMGVLLDRLIGLELDARPLALAVLPLAGWFAGRPADELDRLIARMDAHPDPWLRGMAPVVRGQLRENAGDLRGSRVHLADAITRLRELGDGWSLAAALASDGNAALALGALEEAEAALAEAQALLEAFGSRGDARRLGFLQADVRLRRGDTAGARALLEQVAAATTPGADHLMFVELSLAATEAVDGALDAAAVHVDRAKALLHARGPVNALEGHATALVHAAAAILAVERGDVADARALLPSAHAAAVQTLDAPVSAQVAVAAAWVAHGEGRDAEAGALLGAGEVLRGAPDATASAVVRLRGRLAARLGDEALEAALHAGRSSDRAAAEDRLAAAAGASDPAAVGA